MGVLKLFDGSSWIEIPIVTDHGIMTGLGDDDHPQYSMTTHDHWDYVQLVGTDDVDDYITNGDYKWASGYPIGAPNNEPYKLMQVRSDTSQVHQMVWGGYLAAESPIYIRRRTSGSWTAWVAVAVSDHNHWLYTELDGGDDIDTITSSGDYRWATTPPSGAPNNEQYKIMNVRHDTNRAIQMVWGGLTSAASNIYTRRYTSGSWDAWTAVSIDGHGHAASEITAGAFGTGEFTFDDEVTIDTSITGLRVGGDHTQAYIRVEATDDAGSGVKTTGVVLHGYELRGSGIWLTDETDNRSWFVGKSYYSSIFSINYVADDTVTDPCDSRGDTFFCVTTGGDVGIGTNIPSESLEVVGNAFIDGDLECDEITTGNGTLTSQLALYLLKNGTHMLAAVDPDGVTTEGFYYWGTAHANSPGPNAVMMVRTAGAVVTQFVIRPDASTSAINVRVYSGSWSAWEEVSFDGHNHDSEYYTESETDTLLGEKQDVKGIYLTNTANLDDYINFEHMGWYRWLSSTPVNAPPASIGGYKMMMCQKDGSQMQQVVYGYYPSKAIYMRRRNSGTWQDWATFNSYGYIAPYIHLDMTSGNTDNISGATSTTHNVEWDSEMYKDSDYFTHTTGTNADRILVEADGRYSINATVTGDNAGASIVALAMYVSVNGTADPKSISRAFSLGNAANERISMNLNTEIDLEEDDIIRIVILVDYTVATYTVTTVTEHCECIVRRIGD